MVDSIEEIKDKKKIIFELMEKTDNSSVLDEMISILNKDNQFDFQSEWENGITQEEFLDNMKERIKEYPWKTK